MIPIIQHTLTTPLEIYKAKDVDARIKKLKAISEELLTDYYVIKWDVDTYQKDGNMVKQATVWVETIEPRK